MLMRRHIRGLIEWINRLLKKTSGLQKKSSQLDEEPSRLRRGFRRKQRFLGEIKQDVEDNDTITTTYRKQT